VDAIASRYWVNNGGLWSDNTNHWSDSSGGSPGASKPTSSDSVYFDANSFTGAGQTVTINETANCLDMDWTGALYSPTLTDTVQTFNIYGSHTFISNMTNSITGYIYFYSASTGKTITLAGKSLKYCYFQGTGGWTLQDNFTVTTLLSLAKGTLNTNGLTINCPGFTTSSTHHLILGGSVVNCSGNVTFNSSTTLDAGTSTIKLTGDTATFVGGGLTYNNIEFTGTPITITGSNTFNELKIKAGNTAIMTAGTTQTVTSLDVDGATLQSSSAGSAYMISKTSGTVELYNASIKDCTATGGAVFSATNCTDVSGNTGIIFNPKVKPQGITGRLKNFFH
jgi:hypothetical protein